MRSALASLLSFAATCFYAPALADEIATIVAPGLAGLLGLLGARTVGWLAHFGKNLQSQEAPRLNRSPTCPTRKASSPR